MTNLVVLLPSVHTFESGAWKALRFTYAIFDRSGRKIGAGKTLFDGLPKAKSVVLIVPARDTLLIDALLPQVTGSKLQRLLPNIVEEFLVEDARHAHVAIGPER